MKNQYTFELTKEEETALIRLGITALLSKTVEKPEPTISLSEACEDFGVGQAITVDLSYLEKDD